MQIGTKIYYDLATGNVILNIGEKEGGCVETTLDQDFESYESLSERVKSTVGVIQLTYGQYADKFGVYYYNIDITTKLIVWGDLINVNNPPVVKEPTAQEIYDNQMTIMNGMFDLYMK